jgi:hypothetical protein
MKRALSAATRILLRAHSQPHRSKQHKAAAVAAASKTVAQLKPPPAPANRYARRSAFSWT